MAQEAGENGDLMPGLITVQADHWINVLGVIGAKAATLADALRHRDIKIEIVAANVTAVMTRAEAGDPGPPYRDLSPRV
ncbi:MAG: hypothetical protein JWR59_2211 [Brevundimonas sp.]|nr:hypothetical protein [Brevundimonas sp.]